MLSVTADELGFGLSLPALWFAGKTPAMNDPNDELLRAVKLALAGEWDAAHQIVQQYEDDPTAAWIHATLHKIEGDLGNAGYWYHRANRMEYVAAESSAELAAIRGELNSPAGR